MFFWILLILAFPFVFVLLPTRIIGKKQLKVTKKHATILGCNHQTYNDPIILKCRVCPNFKFMAKHSIFKNKFIGFLLKKCGAYPVNRGANDINAVKTTLKFLKENKKVAIFPEGRRLKSDEEADALKNGLVMFALKTDAYVVPAIFKKRTNLLVFNTLLIGAPFKFSDMEEFKDVKINKEVLNSASNILMEKMNYLKEISSKEYKKVLKEKTKFKKYRNV